MDLLVNNYFNLFTMKSISVMFVWLIVLMLGSGLINSVIAQPGNNNCECVMCHVPCSSPLSSHTNPNCPVYKSNNQGSGETYPSYDSGPRVLDPESPEAKEKMRELYQQHSVDVNNQGVKQYNKGNYKAAAALFRKALRYYPNYGDYLQNLKNAEKMLARENAIKNRVKQQQQATQHSLDEMKAFSNSVNETKASYQKVQNKLHKQLGGYDVPPPTGSRKIIKEGVILGMSNTKDENSIVKHDMNSPFSENKVPFWATTDNAGKSDIFRVALDNLFTGKFTTLATDVGQELVKELDNTYFEVLMAHSNGATVTEALLRDDVIRAKELHIMGGDRSLFNHDGYVDLIATGKVEKVVVWLNPADAVPYGSSLVSLVTDGFHDLDLQAGNFQAYFERIENEQKYSKNIEYRWLSGPEFSSRGQSMEKNFFEFDPHDLEVYWINIRRYRALSPEEQAKYSYNFDVWDWMKK